MDYHIIDVLTGFIEAFMFGFIIRSLWGLPVWIREQFGSKNTEEIEEERRNAA